MFDLHSCSEVGKGQCCMQDFINEKECHQKRHDSPTKCCFSQMSRRNTHQEPVWETTQLLLLTSNHAPIQIKLRTLSGLHYFKKPCPFKMHSYAPKRLFSQMSRRNADIKLMCITSQLQCLTSIHGHKLTKSNGIWELQLLRRRKVHLKQHIFPHKFIIGVTPRHLTKMALSGKLDGVGPVDNRPCTDQLHHFVQQEKLIFSAKLP